MQILEEKPEAECIGGRWVRKMSPKRRHAELQGAAAAAFLEGGKLWGRVGTEWRFHMPTETKRTTLLPDVAFVSHQRMRALSETEADEPAFAPDIAVEIRSPGDRAPDIAEKIGIYLRTGAQLVLDVDPESRSIIAPAADGSAVFAEASVLTRPAFPWLRIELGPLFADIELLSRD